MISFTLYFDPPKSTHQASQRIMFRKDKATGEKVPFIGKYDDSKGKAVKQLFRDHLSPYVPATPIDGPIQLYTDWIFPWNKTEKKSVKELVQVPFWKRPDLDNLLKLFQDVMTELEFYKDDGQIADLHFRKFNGDTPRITMILEEWKYVHPF